MRGPHGLKVYEAAIDYSNRVGLFIRSSAMPKDDAEQLRSAAKSISNNIAEGHGQGVGANRIRYYKIARGSAQESINQLRCLVDDGLLPRKEFYSLFGLGRVIVRMLTKLIGD